MLNFRPLLFILGLFLSMLTAFMFIPLFFALFYGEETVAAFMHRRWSQVLSPVSVCTGAKDSSLI